MRKKTNNALTLAIVMIIALLGVIASVLVIQFMRSPPTVGDLVLREAITTAVDYESAYIDIANRQMDAFKSMIEMYHLDCGTLPVKLEHLRKNPGAKGWHGPYIKGAIPDDPWDVPYHYRHGRIYSAGPDRKIGTNDDLSTIFISH